MAGLQVLCVAVQCGAGSLHAHVPGWNNALDTTTHKVRVCVCGGGVVWCVWGCKGAACAPVTMTAGGWAVWLLLVGSGGGGGGSGVGG